MTVGRRLLIMVATAVAILLTAPLVGPLFSDTDTFQQVLITIRLPRTIAAFLAGATLSLCGMIFQALFRNDLASPYTLGISSGASFGAAVAILLGITSVPMAALLGALIAVAVVWRLSLIESRFGSHTMLLAGVATGFFFSGLTIFVQYLADFSHGYRILHWLMGSLDAMGWPETVRIAPFFLFAVVAALFHRELDILSFGEEAAAARGVDYSRTLLAQFILTSIAVAGIVAATGPIGFVGLIAPHSARLLVGPRHCILTPASALTGGVLLTLCDTLARTLIAPGEIPVGVVTALLGGPFFLWLLLRGR